METELETNGYIERDKVLEVLNNNNIPAKGMRLGKVFLVEHSNKLRDAYINIIKQIPLEDVVEIRHGEWIDIGKTEKGSPIRECSFCKTRHAGRPKYKFCPDCGCMMDAKVVYIEGQLPIEM